jgi:hypothetical protein
MICCSKDHKRDAFCYATAGCRNYAMGEIGVNLESESADL